jgi:hypothetical protein
MGRFDQPGGTLDGTRNHEPGVGRVTVWDMFGAVRRRWWLALIGLVATVAAGLYVQNAGGVYYQQVDVLFIWPQVPENTGNTFQYGTASLIKTAGVVGKIVSDSHSEAQVTADTATLVGEGVRHGYSVRLPNSGGQWALNFERPVLHVETAGTSLEEVEQTTATVLKRINTELAALQKSEGVPAELMVRTQLNPSMPSAEYGSGSKIRALLATQLLGFALTITAVLVGDRWLRRRRSGGPGESMARETAETRLAPARG